MMIKREADEITDECKFGFTINSRSLHLQSLSLSTGCSSYII